MRAIVLLALAYMAGLWSGLDGPGQPWVSGVLAILVGWFVGPLLRARGGGGRGT